VRLGHADGEAPISQPLEVRQTALGLLAVVHAFGAVDFPGDGFDLGLQVQLIGIEQLGRLGPIAGGHHRPGQIHGTLSAQFPVAADHRSLGPGGASRLTDPFQLRGAVRGESVDGHHGGHPEALDDSDVALEVGQPRLQQRQVFIGIGGIQGLACHHLGSPAVHLEAADGRNHHGAIRAKAAHTTLDVHEFLETHVRRKAALGHHVIRQLQRDAVRQDGGITMGDVGEGPRMHQDRRALQGLHQGGLQGILHQHGHGPGHAEILAGDRLPGPVQGHDHGPQTGAEIRQARGQRQDGHQFRGTGDVEAALPLEARFLGPASQRDAPEQAIRSVEHPAPLDAGRIDLQTAQGPALFHREGFRVHLRVQPQFRQASQHAPGEAAPPILALGQKPIEQLLVRGLGFVQQAGIQSRRGQVVGRRDGMHVAREMQVEILHGNDLAVASSGGAALDAEGGPLRGLADAGDDPLVQMGPQGLAQTDGGGGLPFAQRRGRHGRDIDVAAVGPIRQPPKGAELHLRLVRSSLLDLVGEQSRFLRHQRDGLAAGLVGDFQVRGHRRLPPQGRGRERDAVRTLEVGHGSPPMADPCSAHAGILRPCRARPLPGPQHIGDGPSSAVTREVHEGDPVPERRPDTGHVLLGLQHPHLHPAPFLRRAGPHGGGPLELGSPEQAQGLRRRRSRFQDAPHEIRMKTGLNRLPIPCKPRLRERLDHLAKGVMEGRMGPRRTRPGKLQRLPCPGRPQGAHQKKGRPERAPGHGSLLRDLDW